MKGIKSVIAQANKIFWGKRSFCLIYLKRYSSFHLENVKGYKTDGSSLNLNKDRSGYKRIERIQENIKSSSRKSYREFKNINQKERLGY